MDGVLPSLLDRAVSALTSRPRRSRARCCIASLLALACCALPVESAAEGRPRSDDPSPRSAVLVGSSSFNQPFGEILQQQLERRGYQVTRKGVSGAGLARPDFHDMNQVLEALPIGASTAAVFVYLGVNDAQPVWLYPHERGVFGAATLPFGSPEWDAAYARRSREFLTRICQRGAQRAIVLLPVDVSRPDLQQRLVRIRELQARAAAETSCAVAVQTAGDAGHFEAEGVPTRLPDGFHMSARGAQIVWERIEPRVAGLLPTTRL
jgi:hypothetical protein